MDDTFEDESVFLSLRFGFISKEEKREETIRLTVDDRLRELDGGFCWEGNLRKQSRVKWMNDGGKFAEIEKEK